jgi:rhodanese-related sulfurtransferase
VTWDSVDEKIDREYPGIDFISTAQLHQKTQDMSVEFPVLIDVRKPDEFRISHLAGAVNLETGASISKLVADKDAAIVVYCSVGYRSAGVAAELEDLGYSNVQNLRHSLFEWANNDYPMVDAVGDTENVHPFNRVWGVLVEKSRHLYPSR